MKPIIGFAVLVLFAVADGQVESNELEAGRNIFRRYSKTDKWFQNQVEDRRLYEAFVHDLDGDGLLDVVYADGDNHDFSGCLWSAIRFKKEGNLVSSDLMGFDKSINIQARSDQFRKIYGSSSECENAISYPLFMTGCKEMKTGCKHANDRPFGPLGGPGAVFTCSHPCTSPVWRVSRDRAA